MSKKSPLAKLFALAALFVVAALPFVPSAKAQTAAPAATEARVQSAKAETVDLTIYAGRHTQVQETRHVQLNAGKNLIQLDGIASHYRPDSLRIVEAGIYNAPGARPSPQGKFTFRSATYQAANLTVERILQDSVGSDIEVFHAATGQAVAGKLLAVSGGSLVIQGATGEVRMLPSGDVRVTKAPAGLSNSASLVVEAEVSRAGTYEIKFMYETDGLGWSAKHNVVFDEAASMVKSWETLVSVNNNSGVNFKNATVRLMSGGAAGNEEGGREMYRMSPAAAAAPMSDSASVESVGDQKSYVLPGQVSLENGQTRQVMLFSASNVPVVREYFVPAYGYNTGDRQVAVSVRLVIENCAKHNMGSALPAGTVKVYQTGPSGVQQQTGSARMSDKAVDEVFNLTIGTASDVKYTRNLVEQTATGGSTKTAPSPSVRPGRNVAPAQVQGDNEPVFEDQTWEVKVYNYKNDREVEVKVEVALPHDQDVVAPLTKKTATSAEGKVKVGKTSSESLKYTFKVRVR